VPPYRGVAGVSSRQLAAALEWIHAIEAPQKARDGPQTGVQEPGGGEETAAAAVVGSHLRGMRTQRGAGISGAVDLGYLLNRLGSPTRRTRRGQKLRPGDDHSPQHYACNHPAEEGARGSSETEGQDGRKKRTCEQRGLQGHARYPVALPDALYALSALGEPRAAVDPTLQTLTGSNNMRHSHDRAGDADDPAQEGREPHCHAGDDPDPHVQGARGGRGEEFEQETYGEKPTREIGPMQSRGSMRSRKQPHGGPYE
jgi:hypothetical protein